MHDYNSTEIASIMAGPSEMQVLILYFTETTDSGVLCGFTYAANRSPACEIRQFLESQIPV